MSDFVFNIKQSCTAEQIEVLLNFLDKHRDLACGQLRNLQGRAKAKTLWKEITDVLNSMGGGSKKTVKQWQKVWVDKKHLAKKKAEAKTLTESDLPIGCVLSNRISHTTQWDDRVLRILGEEYEASRKKLRVSKMEGKSTFDEKFELLENLSLTSKDSLSSQPMSTQEALSPTESQSSQGPLPYLESSSQVKIISLNSSQPPDMTTQSHPPIEFQMLPVSDEQPTDTTRRRTSKRKTSGESTLSDESIKRLIGLEEEKVEIERKKLAEMKRMRTDLSGLQSSVRELVELMKEYIK